MESAKLPALHAPVPMCLACLGAHVPKCLAFLCPHVPACLACLSTDVPTCLVCLRAHVPTCLACLRAHILTPCVLCVPTISRAMTKYNKDKFSNTFPGYCSLFFSVKKNCWTFLHFYYQSQAFNECYDKLSKIKWLAFCLNITFRVISKRFIEGERWIIMYES